MAKIDTLPMTKGEKKYPLGPRRTYYSPFMKVLPLSPLLGSDCTCTTPTLLMNTALLLGEEVGEGQGFTWFRHIHFVLSSYVLNV